MFDWKISGGDLVMTLDGWSDEEVQMLKWGLALATGEIDEDEIPEDADYYDFDNLADMEYDMLPEDLFVVQPEDAGALTDSILLSDNCTFEPNDSEDPEDMSECHLFYFPAYQIRSYLHDLVEKGEAVWKGSG